MRRIGVLALAMGLACGGTAESPSQGDNAKGDTTAAVPAGDADAPGDAAVVEQAAAGVAGSEEEQALKMEAAPDGAAVFFVSPKDGETVTSPVKVVFGLSGMDVQPAGMPQGGTGHHHLIIGPAGVPTGDVVPADETHIHFGKGQTETEVTLDPGEHTLTMQFADGLHRSFGEQLKATITITVVP